MKTSIQISVIDQHINSADAQHFNTLSGLIWSTCLLSAYTSGKQLVNTYYLLYHLHFRRSLKLVRRKIHHEYERGGDSSVDGNICGGGV